MRRLAWVVVLSLAFGACATGANNDTTTTAKRRVTTSSSSTTTTAFGLAPNGCDVAALHRIEPRSDRTKYTVDATVDLPANEVRGTLSAVFTPDLDTDRIVMRLWPNGPTIASRGGHMNVVDAVVDGKPASVSLTNATTAVAATGPLVAGRKYNFGVRFAVTLPRDLDDRLSRIGNTVRLGSWLPLLPWEPGRGWALDPPTTSNAEASLSVHADFDVHLTAPAGVTVLATGTEVDPRHWVATAVPDWAASIGVFTTASGTSASGVPVTVGVDNSLRETATTYLKRVVPAMDELARRYGAYPWPAYTLAITPNLKGGIEYPGHVMQGPGTNTRTLPHEIAHQWFYGLVGNDQGRDPWIDEGLASWAEAQVDHTYQSFLTKPTPGYGANHLGEAMPYWDRDHSSYYRSVYVQTVKALGALGVSTAAVDCALARYVAINAYRVATPAAVVNALSTVAPGAHDVLTRFGGQRLRPSP